MYIITILYLDEVQNCSEFCNSFEKNFSEQIDSHILLNIRLNIDSFLYKLNFHLIQCFP